MFARVIEEKLADPSHPRRSLRAGHPDSGGDRWLPHTRSAVAVAPSSSYSRFTHTVDQKVQKVRTDPQWPPVPTGEGETIKKALASVSKLSPSQLPMIPGYPNAPESWRRVAALHRELLRLCRHNTYFMSCRDAAQVLPGLSYQAVSNFNHALERLGVIKIVRVGDQRPNGKASEFRYLLGDIMTSVEEEEEQGVEI